MGLGEGSEATMAMSLPPLEMYLPALDFEAGHSKISKNKEWYFKHSVLASQMDPQMQESLQLCPSANGSNPYKIREQKSTVGTMFRNLVINPTKVNSEEKTAFEKLPLAEQVNGFLDSLTLTREQCRIRWQLAADLFFLLREHYPSSQLYVFGSLLTGLGDPDSDIDIYMDYQGDGGESMDQRRPSRQQEIIYDLQGDVGTILSQARCPHNPKEKFAAHVELLGTRVRIVRLVHAPSGIHCDISFGNRISVQNSKLFKFYMEFDPRIKPLLQLLRYWSDFHDLSGSQKIKKYALSLLALVYLTRKKIVPSVCLLQTLSAAQRFEKGINENPDKVDGWDASFCTDLQKIDTCFGNDSLPETYPENQAEILFEMALEFFEMIKSIDEKMAVFPFCGKIIPKESVIDWQLAKVTLHERLRDWRGMFRKENQFCRETRILNPLCLMDPFTFDFNVGGLVDMATFKAFREASEKTAEILRNKPESILALFPNSF